MVSGCWLLVAGCYFLVAGCWLLVVGCWLLVVDCYLLAIVLLLVAGCLSLIVGTRWFCTGSRLVLRSLLLVVGVLWLLHVITLMEGIKQIIHSFQAEKHYSVRRLLMLFCSDDEDGSTAGLPQTLLSQTSCRKQVVDKKLSLTSCRTRRRSHLA